MRSITKIIFVLVIVLFNTRCSVKKRLYRSGFYIATKATKNTNNHLQKQDSSKIQIDNQQLVCSIDNGINYTKYNKSEKCNYLIECKDTILLLTGDTIVCNIVSTTKQIVQYKKCFSDSNNVFSLDKSKIDLIKKSNGEIIEPFILKPKKEEVKDVSPVAVWSSILGLSSVVFVLINMIGLAILCGILGLLLGFIGLIQIQKNKSKYKGKVACFIGILGFLAAFLIFGALLGSEIGGALIGIVI